MCFSLVADIDALAQRIAESTTASMEEAWSGNNTTCGSQHDARRHDEQNGSGMLPSGSSDDTGYTSSLSSHSRTPLCKTKHVTSADAELAEDQSGSATSKEENSTTINHASARPMPTAHAHPMPVIHRNSVDREALDSPPPLSGDKLSPRALVEMWNNFLSTSSDDSSDERTSETVRFFIDQTYIDPLEETMDCLEEVVGKILRTGRVVTAGEVGGVW